MFSKYRIVEAGKWFYPEKRVWLFFWERFREKYILVPTIWEDVKRASLSLATEHINYRIQEKLEKQRLKASSKFHKFANNPNKTN